MLISCKCLNFIASTSSDQNPHVKNVKNVGFIGEGNDTAAPVLVPAPTPPLTIANPTSLLSNNNGCTTRNSNNSLRNALMHAFLQKYPRNFVFYSQCMDFFKQTSGPIPDLTINDIKQRDLIYSLTLDLQQSQPQVLESWQLSVCINCNSILCAKRLKTTQSFLINNSLLTTNDEISQRRANKSFSEAFGILIIDHPKLTLQNGSQNVITPSSSALSINSISNATTLNNSLSIDVKQHRLRQLQTNLQQRLKQEIIETDERIQRYTEQQFALLKIFREKSEQELGILVELIKKLPEQQANEWLDLTPPALEVSCTGFNFLLRRRNTIGSRHDVQSTAPITPTSPSPIKATNQNLLSLSIAATPSAMDTSNSLNTNTMILTTTTTTSVGNVANNRKITHFETPPATPETTPMSVGNSPTFRPNRQQQQQQQQQQQRYSNGNFVTTTNNSNNNFQQQFPTPTTETVDDILFDLEEDESDVVFNASNANVNRNAIHTNNHASALQPHQYLQQQQRNIYAESKMVDDISELSDGAEEAENALDLDSSMPIPLQGRAKVDTETQLLNFAKSLPIEINNSPMVRRTYIEDSDSDEIDNTVDIAASIKALAKSVHGETVFGDLPRPRLSSQI